MFIFKGFSPDEIISFDESRFLIDAPGNYTYEVVGQRRVMATHTGHEKVSVCGLFAATASGKKLPAICLMKRNPSKPFRNLVIPDNIIEEYSAKGIIKFF